jgi:hypothetical protein
MVESNEAVAVMRSNIGLMNSKDSFGVVIVCTSTEDQASYWNKRLQLGKGSVIPASTIVVAVCEDWPGGAGNALGTLYAYQKASIAVRKRFDVDLDASLMSKELSVAIFHTAGKGTRLAPLPGSENNNKPGVKLATCVDIGGVPRPMTILESVIRQTGCYAKSRQGRLSVFWGDQIFVPTVPVGYSPTHHVDILCSLGPMVSEKEWTDRGLQNYGLIVENTDRNALQVDKVDYKTAMTMISSLGSFGKSLSLSLFLWHITHTHEPLRHCSFCGNISRLIFNICTYAQSSHTCIFA